MGVGVVVEPVVLVARPDGGPGARAVPGGRSTPPGSYSIVVIATVEPVANTVTTPRSTLGGCDHAADPSGEVDDVPVARGVSSRSWPPWTATVSRRASRPAFTRANRRFPSWITLPSSASASRSSDPSAHGLAVEPHPALGERAPRLGGRDAERLRAAARAGAPCASVARPVDLATSSGSSRRRWTAVKRLLRGLRGLVPWNLPTSARASARLASRSAPHSGDPAVEQQPVPVLSEESGMLIVLP